MSTSATSNPKIKAIKVFEIGLGDTFFAVSSAVERMETLLTSIILGICFSTVLATKFAIFSESFLLLEVTLILIICESASLVTSNIELISLDEYSLLFLATASLILGLWIISLYVFTHCILLCTSCYMNSLFV